MSKIKVRLILAKDRSFKYVRIKPEGGLKGLLEAGLESLREESFRRTNLSDQDPRVTLHIKYDMLEPDFREKFAQLAQFLGKTKD